MRTRHDAKRPQLTAESLPGPDTATKLVAIKETAARSQWMLREAVRPGWTEAFTEDLYQHDLLILPDHPGKPMLWILRQHGTHLFPVTCDTSHEPAFCRLVIRY